MSSPFPPPDPETNSYTKLRNELMTGGAGDVAADVPVGGTRAAVGLGMIALALAALGWYSGWALLFVVLLLVCIFLHEVGHFATARLTGMKVTQFFMFFGPKLWSFRRGETEYGVRLYPLGAFVRIIGMNNLDEVDAVDEQRTYRSKSYPRRLLVITAGSLMHMVIAIALLFGVYATKGSLGPTGEVQLTTVVAGDPAAEAGVLAGDRVVSIAGVEVRSADEFVAQIRSREPQDIVPLVLDRGGERVELSVGLGSNPNPGPNFGGAYLGVSSADVQDWVGMPLTDAARRSFTDLGEQAWASVAGVVKVLNPVNIYEHLAGTSTDVSTRPTTVVGVTQFSDVVGAETGLGGVLLVLAGVNVFVGLFNLFPLLPFDGGYAAIATYERVRSRRGRPPYRADVAKMIPVTMAVFAVLIMLLLAGLYLDVARPLGG